MDEVNLHKKEKFLLILFALLVGIIFDFLFYRKPLGISYPIYILLLLGLFWWSTRKIIITGKNFGWFILIPVFLLSITFAIYSNPVLSALNFMLIPLLIVVHSLLVTNNNSNWWELSVIGHIVKRVIPLTFENFPKPFLFVAKELRPKESGTVRETGKKILIGLLISVPILFVVVPLLSSADMVFNYYLTNLAKIGELFDFIPVIVHSIVILFVFVYTFGYILSFHMKHPRAEIEKGAEKIIRDPGIEKGAKKTVWDPTIVLTVLFVTNVVYLLFSIIQFSYLYGGQSQSLLANFTYAEYARRGFFELVTVTIINLSILLSSLKFVNKDRPVVYMIVRVSLSLLVVFSLNMLFSAHFKMSLYEKAYGLTYLRIFVHYFIGLLFVLFLIALGNIWLRKIPLVKSYIIVTLVFYTALNFINVDKIIARNNINMYFKTGKLDVYYLQNLSYDAIPEIIRLSEDNNQEIARQVKDYMLGEKQDLSKDRPWQSFNYSRYKANSTLKEYYVLEKYSGQN